MKADRWIGETNIDLEDEQYNALSHSVMQGLEIDETSRDKWLTRTERAMELAMQEKEDKTFPWSGASNIKFPLLTTAAIQFAARAYPAIIRNQNVVIGQVQGDDKGRPAIDPATGGPAMDQEGQPIYEVRPGDKKERADRVARHMSWQLLNEMEEWEEDTDKLMHLLPIEGCAFRKTWFDPLLGRNRSEMIRAKNLVVNHRAVSLETAPRVSHRFWLYPYEVEERMRAGTYREVKLGNTSEDDQEPRELVEQHCRFDLDDDGYEEPIIVTVDRDTHEVLRVVVNFEHQDVELSRGKIARIEPTRHFTKYSFIPNPDGGFYDIGFGYLLDPLNEAINSTINQMVDAGTLQNTGGGFIGSGLRIKSGNKDFRLGEYKPVDSMGGSIRDNIVPMNWPGPSPVLFSLLGMLIEAAKDITSVKDVMTGDAGPSNEAATRTLARIEQGMKVFSSIYKRIYRSLRLEYRKLFRLNGLYLNPETYFTLLDEPEAVGPEDYDASDLDIAPAADPAMVSDMQRMALAEFKMQFMNDPYFDPLAVRKDILEAMGIKADILVKEAPPNAEMMARADELDIEKKKVEIEAGKLSLDERRMVADLAKIQSDIILNLAKAEGEEAGTQINALKTMMDGMIQKEKTDGERRLRDVAAKPGDGQAARPSAEAVGGGPGGLA